MRMQCSTCTSSLSISVHSRSRIGGGGNSLNEIMMGNMNHHQPQHYLDDGLGLGGGGPPGLDPNMAALMHNSSVVNNNNNMVSPSSNSSLSPIHCNDMGTNNGHTSSSASSAALAAAAAASIEAMGHFVDSHMMQQHPTLQKLDKAGTSANGQQGGEGSPKYISL